MLEGRDVMGSAQTGTGKTAGFTLPLLQRLGGGRHHASHRPVRALIMTPTRELAAQVHQSVRDYGKHLPFKAAVIFGGVSMNRQIAEIRRGTDIVVATPGRLLDHARHGTVRLGSVEILVLDEADRMLDMGFLPDIKRILKLLPGRRQNLMFSATFPEEIRRLAGSILHNPAQVQIARRSAPAELINQVAHMVEQNQKRDLLSHLIRSKQWYQVLVFTRTKARANRLTKQLNQDGVHAVAIHGNKSQAARTRALGEFKKGDVQVLVATDIAARGLDIDQLPHIVNFDLPNIAEDYVHRIGRTGRAGREGQATSLVCGEERGFLRNIERLIKKRIPLVEIKDFKPAPRREPPPQKHHKTPPHKHHQHKRQEHHQPQQQQHKQEGQKKNHPGNRDNKNRRRWRIRRKRSNRW